MSGFISALIKQRRDAKKAGPDTSGRLKEIIDIIIAIIIYFSAFSLFVKGIIARFSKKKTLTENANAEPDNDGKGGKA